MLPPAGRHRQEDPAAGYGAVEEPGPPRQPPGPAQRLHSGTHGRWGLDGRKGKKVYTMSAGNIIKSGYPSLLSAIMLKYKQSGNHTNPVQAGTVLSNAVAKNIFTGNSDLQR